MVFSLFARTHSLADTPQQGAAFVLEGKAPLAELLGYAEWLRNLTEDDPYVATWLSRFLHDGV